MESLSDAKDRISGDLSNENPQTEFDHVLEKYELGSWADMRRDAGLVSERARREILDQLTVAVARFDSGRELRGQCDPADSVTEKITLYVSKEMKAYLEGHPDYTTLSEAARSALRQFRAQDEAQDAENKNDVETDTQT